MNKKIDDSADDAPSPAKQLKIDPAQAGPSKPKAPSSNAVLVNTKQVCLI